jgi:mannose-1-phosphate guanylyltransferase/phosphomannomutase
MAGLNATGSHIRDLEVNAAPVNRFTVDSYNNQDGVDIRTRDDDTQTIEIRFFDEEGRDLEQAARRKIEAKYDRNDFRRAFLNELGEIYYPARAREAYTIAVEEKLAIENIRKKKFKIVFDYGYGAASLILPGILGKLDCDVLSLNAFTDETRSFVQRPERSESLKRLGQVVSSFNADMGLLFDNSAERMHVVDDKACALDGRDMLVVMVDLVTRTMEGGKIAVPVNQTSAIEQIARERGFEVVRTKVERPSVMAAAIEPGVVFAGNDEGSYIFPDFIPAFDALLSFTKLLEMLAETDSELSDLLDRLPRYDVMREEVYTSWENKGLIMRQLIEMHQDEVVDSTDGMKVFMGDSRWILILPDQEEPVLHLFAEGRSEDDCRETLDRYRRVIEKSSTSQ